MTDLVKSGTPLYIEPYKEKKVWGVAGIGEYWYGAGEGGKSSLAVSGGKSMPLDRLLAEESTNLIGPLVEKRFGKFLPLVKILTPKGRLSVQFHDKKNELWIVTDIDREVSGRMPSLIVGFNPSAIEKYGDNIRSGYEKALKDYGRALNELIAYLEGKGFRKELEDAGDVAKAASKFKKNPEIASRLKSFLKTEEELDCFYNHVPVAVGDVIPVPQGTLHALGAGIIIVEPQIPGPTQSLEDGATYPVRYFFPDYPVESGKKKLDLDRIGEISTQKWARGSIQVIYNTDNISVEQLPGGFEEKGLQVNRISIPAKSGYKVTGAKSCHSLVAIQGAASVIACGRDFPIPAAKAGAQMLLVPASCPGFTVFAGTDSQVLDIFTPI